MKKAELRIAVAPTLRAALEQAARDNACSLPVFVESLLSEHLTARGYLRRGAEHGIPISQLNAENDG
jgi:hypothetical protein